MKKIPILVLALFLLPIVFAIETNTTAPKIEDIAAMNVISTKYEPYPVGPGEYFDIWLKIENAGDKDAANFTFKLTPEFPFYLDASEEAERNFGKFTAHQIVLVKYRVRVDENAVEGDNYLKYLYSLNGIRWTEGQVKIKVQTLNIVLNIESVETEPEKITPGEKLKLTITLENMADSTLKNIVAKLDLFRIYRGTTAYAYYEVPFTPVGQSNEKMLYQLLAREKRNITFDLVADSDAEAKVHKVLLNINYFDELGKNYTKDYLIGLLVSSEPDFSVTVEESKIYGTRQTGEITIKFVNKGLADIKFLNVVLKESENYDIVSSDEVYVGNVDSDDYETVEFKLYLKKVKDKKVTLPLYLEYKDANNYPYSVDLDVVMNVRSLKQGAGRGGVLGRLIFVIVAIVVGYFLYRRWEKKKKKK